MVVSSEILSEHYVKPHSYSPKPIEIRPKDIKSMVQLVPNSFGSHDDLPSQPTFMDGIAVMRSSGRLQAYRRADIEKYGLPTSWDESGPRMDSWNFAAKGNYSSRHNLIPQTPPVLYIEGLPQRMHFTKGDTPVDLNTSHNRYIGPINQFGLHASTSHNNTYAGLRNLLWSDGEYRGETLEKIDFRLGAGLKPRITGSPVFGIGISHDDKLVAAYYSNQRYVVTHFDFHNRVRKLAAKYGLKDQQAIRAFMRRILAHETIDHGMFGIGPERADEELTGLLDEGHYSNRAKLHEGTKWAKINRALAQSGRDYAESFSIWQALLDEASAEPFPKRKAPHQRLVEALKKEAEAYELSPEDAKSYVGWRLRHIYGELLESEPSQLERIANEEGAERPARFVGKETKESNKKGRTEDITEKYERRIEKSEYKNMKDVKERGAKAEAQKGEGAPQEAEAAETPDAA